MRSGFASLFDADPDRVPSSDPTRPLRPTRAAARRGEREIGAAQPEPTAAAVRAAAISAMVRALRRRGVSQAGLRAAAQARTPVAAAVAVAAVAMHWAHIGPSMADRCVTSRADSKTARPWTRWSGDVVQAP
jgi:hypothetical protein